VGRCGARCGDLKKDQDELIMFIDTPVITISLV